MKATEFRSKKSKLKESYGGYRNTPDSRDPFAIRAKSIQSFLEWYDDELIDDWDNGFLPELLAINLEAIGARGNESPDMTTLMKIAVKKIVEQYHAVHEEGYLPDNIDDINAGCERLKKLGVFPDLLTAMQKSMAATVKAELDQWIKDNPDEQY